MHLVRFAKENDHLRALQKFIDLRMTVVCYPQFDAYALNDKHLRELRAARIPYQILNGRRGRKK